jgi:hypothetical protein
VTDDRSFLLVESRSLIPSLLRRSLKSVTILRTSKYEACPRSVRRNHDGLYDVAKLFEGIPDDKAFQMEDQPKAEKWELD